VFVNNDTIVKTNQFGGNMNQEQLDKMRSAKGFIAALDQSGGSTPKALAEYGISESEYSGEEEMFTKVHEMRTRIMTASSFSGDKIIGAILFENTMDRQVNGKSTAAYLWQDRNIVPFLKIDKGLADEQNGVQLLKPIPELDDLLQRAITAGIFGTKMRSVIKSANPTGIATVVDQQFKIANQILSYGLMPIVEPEVDINAPDKAEAEQILKSKLIEALDEQTQPVILKLTLPTEANFYSELMAHKNVVRVVALSGGYPRVLANQKLAENNGMIASFSRALAEGLSASQSDEEFNATIASSIETIYQASIT